MKYSLHPRISLALEEDREKLINKTIENIEPIEYPNIIYFKFTDGTGLFMDLEEDPIFIFDKPKLKTDWWCCKGGMGNLEAHHYHFVVKRYFVLKQTIETLQKELELIEKEAKELNPNWGK